MTNKEFKKRIEELYPDSRFLVKIIGPALDNVLVQFTITIQKLFPEDVIRQLKYPDLFIKTYIGSMLIALRNELDVLIKGLEE